MNTEIKERICFTGNIKGKKFMEKILTGKRAKSFIMNYKLSDCRTLDDVYKSYSKEKETAFNECLNEMARNNGFFFRIISHNTSKFTFGYLTDNIIQGQSKYTLHIITKDNLYIMEYK